MIDKILVAKLGKAVGLKGEIRFFLETDFPEIFQVNSSFITNKNRYLTIESVNFERGLLKFIGIDTIDDAKKLTNSFIYMSGDETKNRCKLQKDEYFWFDIIGLDIFEQDLYLGKVKDIQRFPSCDYLEVLTNKNLDIGLKKIPNIFLIPYLDNFIDKVDLDNKKLFVKNSIDILKAS